MATSDGLYHLFRAVQLEVCLAEGTWYPRWAPDFAQGLGYPIFNFYAPLGYYLQALVHATGLDAVDTLKAVIALALVAAGVGTFLFARDLLGSNGGLLAALAYVYAPTMFLQAFVRADLAELLALAELPFVLWSFRRLAAAPSPGRLAAAGGFYAALVLSHNLTALFFSGALAAYCLLLALQTRGRSATLHLAGGLFLGLALSAFFWLPALGERGWVQMDNLLPPVGADYRDYFLRLDQLFLPQLPVDERQAGAAPDHRFGAVQLLLALLGLAALTRRRLAATTNWQIALLAVLAAVFSLLTTPVSALVWQVMPFGGLVQFPWRFLGMANPGLALLAGAAALWLPAGVPEGWWRRLVAPLALSATALALVLSLGPYFYFPDNARREENVGDGSLAAALAYERWTGWVGTSWRNEYLPKEVKYLPVEPVGSAEAPQRRPLERLDRSMIPSDAGLNATLVAQRGDYEAYRTQSANDVTVLFKLLYYPAWHAYADGRELAVSAFPGFDLGWVTFTIPAGEHLVELRFEQTPLAQAGGYVSVTALLLVAALVAAGWSGRRERPAVAPATGETHLATWALTVVALLLFAGKLLLLDGHAEWFRYTSPAGTAPPAQQQLAVNFENQVLALGYSLDRQRARPGETVRVSLYWQLAAQPSTDYGSFVALVAKPGGKLLARAQGLRAKEMLTSIWLMDKFYEDPLELRLPADLPPGEYTLVFGLYDTRAGNRELAVAGTVSAPTYSPLAQMTVAP